MKSKTYDEWKACDYHVIKGQHSHQRNAEGKCLFERSQVERNVHFTSWDCTTKFSKHIQHEYTDTKEPETVYYADGSGYRPASGPCGPLYFDKFGNT